MATPFITLITQDCYSGLPACLSLDCKPSRAETTFTTVLSSASSVGTSTHIFGQKVSMPTISYLKCLSMWSSTPSRYSEKLGLESPYSKKKCHFTFQGHLVNINIHHHYSQSFLIFIMLFDTRWVENVSSPSFKVEEVRFKDVRLPDQCRSIFHNKISRKGSR